MDQNQQTRPELVDTTSIARKAEIGLYVMMAMSVVVLPADFWLNATPDGKLGGSFEFWMMLCGLMAVVILSSIASFVLWITWLCRTYINSMRIVSDNPPGKETERIVRMLLIVGSFIPVVSSIIPYLVFRRLWRMTDSRVLTGEPWQRLPFPLMLHACWILSLLNDVDLITLIPSVPTATYNLLSCMGTVFALCSSVLFIAFLRAITERQQHQIHVLQRGGINV